MDAFEITGSLIAGVSMIVAAYFIWRQVLTLRLLREKVDLPADQRSFLREQSTRRLLGSFLLMLLAGLLIGSLFLDYAPMNLAVENAPAEDQQAKDALRFLSIYWMILMLVIMGILTLAVFDLWAVARFGVQQRKQLMQDHQNALEEELARLRQRHSELQ